MGFPQARILEWLPFPPPGDLPNPGIEPASPVAPALAGRFFITEPPGNWPLCPASFTYHNTFEFFHVVAYIRNFFLFLIYFLD